MAEAFDVVIVGGGAAGFTAALYASRRGLRTVVVTQDIGGQASTTAEVENYPGIDKIDGLVLMEQFKSQAEKFGAKVVMDEVTNVKQQGQDFEVTARLGSYKSAAVIMAYGLTHRHLNVPGEEALIGKGVSYCATCDAPLFKKKKVAVVGGGNSAMDAALLLSKLGNKVSIITHNPEFHGEKVLIEKMQADSNVTPIVNATTKSIQGDQRVAGITYEVDGQAEKIAVDGIFVEIGFTVNPDLARELAALDERNQVIVDVQTNATNVPGLFAAGDVTTIAHKQIVISAGEGAKAALGVYQYLQKIGRAEKKGPVDWGVTTPLRHEQ